MDEYSSTRVELQNPLLSARFELGLTQFDVAEEVGVTRNFIVRAESAEYPEAPKNLLEYYSGGDKGKELSLREGYLGYQSASRKEHYGLLYPGFSDPYDYLFPGHPTLEHPLTFWAKRTCQITPDAVPTYPLPSTLYAVCRAFCVHHAVMYRWVNDSSVKSVPKIFLSALFESGYNEASLIALEGAYEQYRS